MILDGELVCLDAEGKPDFAALRNRLGRRPGPRRPGAPAAMLMIFDALHVAGRELLAELELEGPAGGLLERPARCRRTHLGQRRLEIAVSHLQGSHDFSVASLKP